MSVALEKQRVEVRVINLRQTPAPTSRIERAKARMIDITADDFRAREIQNRKRPGSEKFRLGQSRLEIPGARCAWIQKSESTQTTSKPRDYDTSGAIDSRAGKKSVA